MDVGMTTSALAHEKNIHLDKPLPSRTDCLKEKDLNLQNDTTFFLCHYCLE
ncbi:hypothetical protein Q7O_002028 [Pectobacterium carotovorum subsp. carotovorum PCCS1]|nr:hypothetical protein [Pectobacterium carotovorum subsp. carotovorum PCCS1]